MYIQFENVTKKGKSNKKMKFHKCKFEKQFHIKQYDKKCNKNSNKYFLKILTE